MSIKSIIIVGVGGQGTLLASRVLGSVAIKSGFDVKLSEVHGMSQRGGSVVTYVKYGEKVYSPLIEEGEADIIISFEQLEAYRWIKYLKPNGKLITNIQKMDPMPVIIGKAKYPENIIDKISDMGIDLIALDALEIARECGTIKAVNIVLLGVLAASSEIPKDVWLESIKDVVPKKVLELNLNAFEKGYEKGSKL